MEVAVVAAVVAGVEVKDCIVISDVIVNLYVGPIINCAWKVLNCDCKVLSVISLMN